MILKVKKLNDKAHVPFVATKGSAGMDLYACLDGEITRPDLQLHFLPLITLLTYTQGAVLP